MMNSRQNELPPKQILSERNSDPRCNQLSYQNQSAWLSSFDRMPFCILFPSLLGPTSVDSPLKFKESMNLRGLWLHR